MRRFCQAMDPSVQDSTFLESCGVADLITTCYGGRNRRCAERFAEQAAAAAASVQQQHQQHQHQQHQQQAEGDGRGGASWEELEREELGGQKLQGTHTAAKLFQVLQRRGLVAAFPLFSAVYQIAFEGRHPSAIVKDLQRRRRRGDDADEEAKRG